MPPTIQSGDGDRDKRPPQRPGAERRSDILCRVKYSNTLPDIPFDLKFITYPFETTRFIQYNPTSLERSYKYEVLTEHDLGVHIDLINREIYQGDGYAQLDPADEKLLEEDVLTPQDSKRSMHHAKSVSWLRRSEYISTEQTRFQPQTMEKIEAKVGFNVKKSFNEETMFMDRDSQIKAIDKTFIDNKITIDKHYSKPGVTPVEVMPIFPDFDLWKYPCAQVIFDTDPAPADKNISAQIEQMSQAMIRGVMDESGEQFVAYFLPTDETLQQRKKDVAENIPYTDGDSYEYKMAREYNWNVKSKASKGYEENYFLVMRNGCVFYNELETRVRLSKRRARGPNAGGTTRLVVSHRPLAAREHRMLRLREKQLEPPQDEDEDEEEEEEDEEQPEEEQQEQQKPSSRKSSRSRSKSKSRSKSGSPVPSRNGKSPSESPRARSGSGSRAGSAERSHSASRASSRAETRKSRSRSRSQLSTSQKSKSGTPKSKSASPRSRSVSESRKSRSGSRRSRSGSRKSGSGSPRSRSGSGSQKAASQRSGSGSPARSGSGSPARSGSGSPARSGSGSPARSGSGSPARSGSGSPAKSASARSRSGSRASSRSGSASNAGSKASSRRNSASGNESERSRSKSGSRQGSRSGSASSRSSRQSGSGSE